mmetsp:Transcript_980/g.1755  ORF Transcript_980/g.1755 Transcript_980/m.1755 type:complete len:222 (+) Transcript_980:1338-2003(+)
MEVSKYNQKYQILLIITDGIISDMEKTINEIVRGSDNPLSIVIVGVGSADFDRMDDLDADTEPLYSKKYKRYMSRDIVQFVPFREFRSDPYKLARETLQEIPNQLTDFFLKKNIFPNPAKEQQRQQIMSKLSLRSKVNPNQQLDLYTSKLKDELMTQCENMGIDTFQVQDFIEEKGLYENNVNIVLDLINWDAYINPLFVKKVKPLPKYGGFGKFQDDPQD